MNRIYFILIFVILYLCIDIYIFMAIRPMSAGANSLIRRLIFTSYWSITGIFLTHLLLYNNEIYKEFKSLKLILSASFFILFVGKLFTAIFLLLDDIRRGIIFLVKLIPVVESNFSTSRADFMTKSALIIGAVPVATLAFGVVSGAYDYRVRKRTIYFPNLPSAFDGIIVCQLSDIHTGSFFNKRAVAGGVDMLLAEKPDLIFFTGDLVNNKSEEAKAYLDIFKRVKAPLGTYSIMGNHDYGDYASWPSNEAKMQDITNLHQMHHYMGYDLLLNENRTIELSGEKIAVLGCENWGAGRFSKYGDMKKTFLGCENIPFKILLSHDPSHWDAQIRKDYPSIDLMLAGHTHGFQFGIEIGNFRWSPVQYRYKQWADLYQENNQSLYVNRGYGFIGYPGRVGILPEITILELKRG